MDFSDLEVERLKKLQRLRDRGIDPYPARVERTHTNQQVIEAFNTAEPTGETVNATVVGRLVLVRPMGKASFAHIEDGTSRLQIYMKKEEVGEAPYEMFLKDLDLGDWVRFDPRIVRGLAYYTGIVFEIFDRKGELRAVCGGGRYDQLLEMVSGVSLPALGFGMGDVVLKELLVDRGLLPSSDPAVDYYLVAVGEDQAALVRRLATRLRAGGHSVLYALRGAGVKAQFKDANARGARRVVVVGPDEVAAGVVAVRDMASGEEEKVRIEDL